MSPSWRDRIEVYLGARSVHLARVRRGLRPRSEPADRFEVSGAPGWNATIEALRGALPGYAPAGAEVHVALSNQFVRYAMVPGIEALASDAERTALAAHQFQSVYGERTAGWRVALAEHGTRSAELAAALDAELFDALSGAVAAAGYSLRAAEPLLAVAFNACRREIGKAAAWLAVVEPDRLCVAHLAGGKWLTVRNARASRTPGAELPAVLEQLRLTLGANPGPLFLASHERVEIEPGPDWPLHRVPLGAAAQRAEAKAA